jgi:hypothetical protein
VPLRIPQGSLAFASQQLDPQDCPAYIPQPSLTYNATPMLPRKCPQNGLAHEQGVTAIYRNPLCA